MRFKDSRYFNWLVYILFGIAGAVYILLLAATIQNSPAGETGGLGGPGLLAVGIAFGIPISVSWLIGARGFLAIRRYRASLPESAEKTSFGYIAAGNVLLIVIGIIGLLVFNLPNYSEALTVPAVISRNYIFFVLPLLAFWFSYKGTTGLVKLVPNLKANRASTYKWLAFSVALVVFSTILALTEPANVSGVRGAFYLSISVVLVTLILPAGIAWALGGLAVRNFVATSKQVEGVIYKEALNKLASGTSKVVVSSILWTVFTTSLVRLGSFGPPAILIVLYITVIVQIIGYVQIARGANKLNLIEKV